MFRSDVVLVAGDEIRSDLAVAVISEPEPLVNGAQFRSGSVTIEAQEFPAGVPSSLNRPIQQSVRNGTPCEATWNCQPVDKA